MDYEEVKEMIAVNPDDRDVMTVDAVLWDFPTNSDSITTQFPTSSIAKISAAHHPNFLGSLGHVFDNIFWAADADNDDYKWTSVYTRRSESNRAFANALRKSDGFTYQGKKYKVKLVESWNDTVRVGNTVWWESPEYRSNKPRKLDWDYATAIEITQQGDSDILRVWQTYGEPHGAWDWDLKKSDNPAAINYLRLK